MGQNNTYKTGFIPYALAAFLIGIVGGFSTVLGPAFVQDIGIAYNNTTWTALAQAMSTAACAPVLGKLGDVIGRRTTLLLGIAIYGLGNGLSALADSLLFMMISEKLTKNKAKKLNKNSPLFVPQASVNLAVTPFFLRSTPFYT